TNLERAVEISLQRPSVQTFQTLMSYRVRVVWLIVVVLASLVDAGAARGALLNLAALSQPDMSISGVSITYTYDSIKGAWQFEAKGNISNINYPGTANDLSPPGGIKGTFDITMYLSSTGAILPAYGGTL